MIVDCAHYRDGVRQAAEPLTLAEARACRAAGDGFVWLGLLDPSEDELVATQEIFSLHELAVDDTRAKHSRPKFEAYEGHYFVVLRTARYDDAREQVDFGEVQLFLGDGFAVLVREGRASELATARRRLEARPDLLAAGPVAVLWGVLDKIVDDYEPVVRGLERDGEEVEASVFSEAASDATVTTQRIYFLKRELSDVYRTVHPLLGPLDSAERGAVPQLEPLRSYFRDVNDHVKLVNEEVVALRDQLTSILQASISLSSHRQNEVVRKISGWAAIIAVPTFIASVYGMNFGDMPELHWAFGYPLALAMMGVAAISASARMSLAAYSICLLFRGKESG